MQPYGFDVGQSERGIVLKGLDLGVQGMRVGGQVRDNELIVPLHILHMVFRVARTHTTVRGNCMFLS